MDIEVTPDVLDISKVKRPPRNVWRRNMARHVTKRKRGKGAHVGIVQKVFEKKRKERL